MKFELKTEYTDSLSKIMASFKKRSYSELSQMANSSEVETFSGKTASGQDYQVEVQIMWDDKEKTCIRVDGGIAPNPHPPVAKFIPIYVDTVTDGFFMLKDGTIED